MGKSQGSMRTIITYMKPPSYDFIKKGEDPNRLSQKSYVIEFIHIVDIHNFITYFYPSDYDKNEGYVFDGIYTLEKTIQKLPECFNEFYHKKFNYVRT